jgi:hypothetical protein
MPGRLANKPSHPKNSSQIPPSAALEKLAEIAMRECGVTWRVDCTVVA